MAVVVNVLHSSMTYSVPFFLSYSDSDYLDNFWNIFWTIFGIVSESALMKVLLYICIQPNTELLSILKQWWLCQVKATAEPCVITHAVNTLTSLCYSNFLLA